MKVALVHEWLTVPAGSEEVFAQMCQVYPEAAIFSCIIDETRCTFCQGRELHKSFLQKMPFAITKHQIYAPLGPEAYKSLDLSGFDLVLSSSHSFAHGVRKAPGALHISYYHTPARSLWVPEIDPRATKTWFHRLIARRLKRLDLEASKQPDYLLSNSQTTADRLKKFYGRDVYRVIYPPVRTTQWLDVQRESEDEGFLYWGRLIEYKRVDLLIEAARKTGAKLNIVGAGPSDAALRAQANGLANVIFHGRLPDAKLKELMARSRAVLFAAYEDFGIVPVEAMAAGLPVVCYAVGGAAESVLPEFGVHFHEQTVESLVDAMARLEGKTFDPAALKSHAAKFDEGVFRARYKDTVDELWAKHVAV